MTSQSYCSARNTPYFVNRPRSTIYIPLNKRSKFSDRHNKASPGRGFRAEIMELLEQKRSVSIVIEMTTIVVSIVVGSRWYHFARITKIIVIIIKITFI